MSKLFYDHLVVLEEVEVELDRLTLDRETREEIDQIIESTLHHRVMDKILRVLPKTHHRQFLERFKLAPHDPSLLRYLDEKIEASVQDHIKDEVAKLKREILADIKETKTKK